MVQRSTATNHGYGLPGWSAFLKFLPPSPYQPSALSHIASLVLSDSGQLRDLKTVELLDAEEQDIAQDVPVLNTLYRSGHKFPGVYRTSLF